MFLNSSLGLLNSWEDRNYILQRSDEMITLNLNNSKRSFICFFTMKYIITQLFFHLDVGYGYSCQ